MRVNKMQKLIVPIAIAAALTFGSPLARAGEAARLNDNKAQPTLAVKRAPNPWLQDRRLLVDELQNFQTQPSLEPKPRIPESMHEECVKTQSVAPEVKAGPERSEEKGQKAPAWLKWLTGLSALASISIFYACDVRKVKKTNNTVSFSLSSQVLSLTGAVLWIGYGIAIKDWWIAGWTVPIIPGMVSLMRMKWKNRAKDKEAGKPLTRAEKAIFGIVTSAAVLGFSVLAAVKFLTGDVHLGVLATGLGFVAMVLRNTGPCIQTVKTVISQSTKSFNLFSTIASPFLLTTWVAYGWMLHALPVLIANLFGVVRGCITATIKVKNWLQGKEEIKAED